jgi:hypothetical protein
VANNNFASDYIDVAQRISDFRAQYPDGSLQPANLEKPYEVLTIGDQTFIVYAAAAYRSPDDPRPGIGLAYEAFPGKSNFTRGSELQNAETSAWGRAIVAALAGDTKRSIASAEEVRNRQAERAEPNGNGASNGHANSSTASVKAQIWSAAKAKGWSQSDLEIDFASSHEGLAIGSADETQLAAYAEKLVGA